MVEVFYDPLVNPGLEGFLNWANSYTEGWFASAFIVMVWIVSTYVLSKSEWKLSNVVTFTSFLTFLLSLIMSLFMSVNGYLIFFTSTLFIISLSWSIIDRR